MIFLHLGMSKFTHWFQRLPVDHSALRDELARIKAEKLARRLEREQNEGKAGGNHSGNH
jgi:hypothetical protein